MAKYEPLDPEMLRRFQMGRCNHIQKHPDCRWCYEHGPGQEELFDFQGTWYVRHADGTTEDIVLEHGNLVEDAKGSAGQFILRRVQEQVQRVQVDGVVMSQPAPRHGSLRFLQGKVFVFLRIMPHLPPHWYEVNQQPAAHPASGEGQKISQAPADASGKFPPGVCPSCGFMGLRPINLLGHQATARRCPECGHYEPVANTTPPHNSESELAYAENQKARRSGYQPGQELNPRVDVRVVQQPTESGSPEVDGLSEPCD